MLSVGERNYVEDSVRKTAKGLGWSGKVVFRWGPYRNPLVDRWGFGTATNGIGGDVSIHGGQGTKTSIGGNIYLTPGKGTEADGSIYMELNPVVQGEAVLYNTANNQITYGTQSSDIKFKTNLELITNPLDKITQINGYTFNYNNDASIIGFYDMGTVNAGLIAQEVEKVFPEPVKDRNINNTEFKQLKYEQMIPLLLEGIKELKGIVDAQQIEINELKEQIK